MKNLSKVLSLLGLLLTLLPAILYFYGMLSADMHKLLMAAGMFLWFLSAPVWMNTSSD